MKKLLLLAGILLVAGCSTQNFNGNQNLGASVLPVYGGGTGTSTITKGYFLMGKGNNVYTSIASTSFAFSSSLNSYLLK
jgi:hypothetical protein